jgi:ATP-dependent protease Clp ATPase subunit
MKQRRTRGLAAPALARCAEQLLLENVMLDIMYDIPSETNIRECIISEEVIQSKETPIILYESEAEVA